MMLLAAAAFATAIGGQATPSGLHHSDHVVAIDGDTLVARVGLTRVHLRLNGIDAPELPGHCRVGRSCAPGDPFASKANLARLIADRRVTWRALKTDKYGRTVAEPTVRGVDLSCAQLRGGFAIYRPTWDDHHQLGKICRGRN